MPSGTEPEGSRLALLAAGGLIGRELVTVFTENEFPSWSRSDLRLGSLL